MYARPAPNSTLDELQRRVRSQICRSCAWRSPRSRRVDAAQPLPCQVVCPLFQSLPRLLRVAQLLDPSLRPYEGVLSHRIDAILKREGKDRRGGKRPMRSPLTEYRGRLIPIIRSLVD
jgi:hypothetical protein